MNDGRHQLPTSGQMARLRKRLYLIEQVGKLRTPGDSALVRLSCVTDDKQGQSLDVLWDREVVPKILTAEAGKKRAERGFDVPRFFCACLNTFRWSCVTANHVRWI